MKFYSENAKLALPYVDPDNGNRYTFQFIGGQYESKTAKDSPLGKDEGKILLADPRYGIRYHSQADFVHQATGKLNANENTALANELSAKEAENEALKRKLEELGHDPADLPQVRRGSKSKKKA